MNYTDFILYFCIGLVCITLIDTVGAIASRKLNFKYVYLSILSFLVYIFIGYIISKQYNLTTAIYINGILGFYDGTIGFWLSIKLKANNGLRIEQSQNVLGLQTGIIMTVVAIIFAFIGYSILSI
jgi:hypothetical protein